MAELALRRYSWEEYLQLEEVSVEKNEYFDGHILAMAGGSPEHAILSAVITAMLWNGLIGRPCTVHSSDQRLRVLATGLATYPDVSVYCGTRENDPESRDTLTNPIALVEVLSPSTETYDRTEKFLQYKQIPSLRAYVLVNTRVARLECYSRGDDGKWSLTEAGPGQALAISALDVQLDTDAVYAGVELPRAETPRVAKGRARKKQVGT